MKTSPARLVPGLLALAWVGCLERPSSPPEEPGADRYPAAAAARAAAGPISLPGRIQVEDYRSGGPGVGFHDLTSGNSGRQYRTDHVDIEAASDAGGGYNVGWIDAGEWLAYDVSVAQGGIYTLGLRMASAVGGAKTAVVSVDGAAVATFHLTDASGWQAWKDVVVPGVPLTAGSHVLRISMATGGFNLNHLDVTAAIKVDDPPPAPGPARVALPGRVQAEDYKAGGPGVGFHDLTAGNTGGAHRADAVDIEATSDAGGGHNVGWIDAGEWLAYDVSIAQAGTYRFTLRMASAMGGTKSAAVSVNGAQAGTFDLADGSGWQSWRDVSVSGVRLAAGNHTLRIDMRTGGFNLNHLDVAKEDIILPPPPATGFSDARFNFGTTYRGDSQKEVHYLYRWIGYGATPFNDSYDGQFFRDVSPGGKFAGKTPFVYAYIIAFTARADLGLKDCNVGSPNLCEDGANYIRQNKARILGQYRSWAEGIARTYKGTGPVVWMMEPDYYQYTDRTQKGGPLSGAELGAFMGEIVRTVRAALPKAVFSMDVSPWISDQAAWFRNFNMADFAYLNTSGGGKRADSEFLTHDNITRWRDLHRITGKKIIADCGYGVAGASTGHDPAWDNPVNIRARMADGVIAVHQANPRPDWDAVLAALKPQLQ